MREPVHLWREPLGGLLALPARLDVGRRPLADGVDHHDGIELRLDAKRRVEQILRQRVDLARETRL